MRLLTFLILFSGISFLPLTIQAQQADLDSLVNVVTTNTLQDTNRVQDLIQIASGLFRSFPDSARAYSLEAAELAEDLGYKTGEAAAYRNIGMTYGVQSDMAQSTVYFERAKEIYTELGDVRGLANINASIGVNNARERKLDLAIEAFLEAVDSYEAYGNLTNMGIMLNNVGNLFYEQKLNEQALGYYERAKEVLEEVNHERSLVLVYVNLALVYNELGNVKEAKKYAELCIEYGLKTERYTTISIPYNLLGDIYRDRNEFDTALTNYREALKYSELTNSTLRILDSKYKIASVDIELGNYQEAKENLVEVITSSTQKPEFRTQEVASLELLIRAERELGNPESALDYALKLNAVVNSVHEEEMALRISELETIYETEKKNAQIQLLEVESQVANLRSLVIGIIAVFVILAISIGFWQFYTRRAEQKRVKIESMKQELKRFGMVISEKNTFISQFREDLEKVRNHVHSYEGRRELTLLSDNIHNNMNLTGDERVLFQKVEQVNAGFFAGLKKLKHELTPKEERLATLVQMDLTNKDIANILHVEPDTVKGARRRLKRKLDLDANTDLTDYLKRITA